jgi:sulfite exporter TauE/SafE
MTAGTLAVLPAHLSGVTPGTVELGVFFVVGLLGGAHCLGMCGPLVTMYGERMAAERSGREDTLTTYEVRQHALFNLGRTVSYATLGAAFGLAGLVFFDASSITRFERPLRIVSGLAIGTLIVAVGTRYVLGRQGGHSFPGSGAFSRVYGYIQGVVDGWATGPGIFGLGLVHGLLPCPLLYPAFLYAFAQGSPVGGALALGLLGIGTFPTLFLYGTVLQSVGPTHRQRLHRVLGVAFVLMGWMLVSHSLALAGIAVPHVEIPTYQPLSG